MGFVLFILSFVLVAIFAPVGIIFTIIKTICLFNLKYINDYYKNMAISLDKFGNVAMSGLFNAIFITSTLNKFGNTHHTISHVLGKNKLAGTLSWFGRRLDALLNGLDENHSIKSIDDCKID